MPSVKRKTQVPYNASQMFDLVNDVEAYPQFLQWCRGAHIQRTDGDVIEAVVDIGIGGLKQSFTTKNTLERPNSIAMELVSGPFRHLQGGWRFTDLSDGGSEVCLELDFEVQRSPLSVVFATVFEELARAQMSAFVRRAEQQYG